MTDELLPSVGSFTLQDDIEAVLYDETFYESIIALEEDAPWRAASAKRVGRKKGLHGTYIPNQSVHIDPMGLLNDPFMQLTPILLQTLRLHMQGLRVGEIADILRVTENAIHVRLSDDRLKAAKAKILASSEEDIQALSVKVVDVYRNALDSKDIDTQLKAADRIMKAAGRAEKKNTQQSDTATSQLQQVLAQLNIQVNVNK